MKKMFLYTTHTHFFTLYLFEELQVHGHLKETSHGAGTVRHKALFAEGDWLSLGRRKLDLMTTDSPCSAKNGCKRRCFIRDSRADVLFEYTRLFIISPLQPITSFQFLGVA